MKKKSLIILAAALTLLYFFSRCNPGTSRGNGTIPADPAIINAGEVSFTKNCSGCHNFRQDDIGPQLGGVTTRVSVDWIKDFIKSPQQTISSGDDHARELYKKYKTVMPSFAALKEDEIDAIIAFMQTHESSAQYTRKEKGNGIANPIPDTIPVSGLVVNLKPFAQIPPSNDSAPKARITKLSFQPNTGRLFVIDLRGKLYKLQHGKPTVYMDISKWKPKFINEPGLATGFGSFAFHPDFAKNGLIYTTHTEAPGSGKADFSYADSIKVTLQWVLTEWKAVDPEADTFSGTGRELLRVNMVTGIHGVQEITFNPLAKPGGEDYGILYMGIGDGGAVGEGYPFLAHSRERIWGTILRIAPAGRNSNNGQYGIPADNPFVKTKNTKTQKEIYAYGFRNPHRITWTGSGKMLVSNIGQANIESINLVMPGHDYGWPLREGNFVSSDVYENMGSLYPLPENDSIYNITYPVAQYDHDEGQAIAGGFEYWGASIPQLKGKFLFGDIPSGRLFYTDTADIKQENQASIKEWKILINNQPKTLKEVCGSNRVDLHFGRDLQGDLYVLTKADGKIYKVVSAIMKPSNAH